MNFVKDLQESDYAALRINLHRLIERHPLARTFAASEFSDSAAQLKYEDFAQELFLILWQKNRFAHYLHAGMTSAQIGAQISRLEISNFLMAKIRKTRPESFRLAQRISKILRSSKSFTRFDTGEKPTKFQQFGLTEWAGTARAGQNTGQNEIERAVASIPVPPRDGRAAGRGGTTALVINNSDLESLIVAVFKAIDTPVSVSTLRRLVLSRLPVIDAQVLPIMNFIELGANDAADASFICNRPNPERNFLLAESRRLSGTMVEEFLRNLFGLIKTKRAAQKRLLLKILLRYYLLPGRRSKKQLSVELNVSKSWVGEYIKKIVSELKKLDLTDISAASRFESALLDKAKELLEADERDGARAGYLEVRTTYFR